MTLEMGKTLRSAIAEVEKSAMGCRFYAENAESILADQTLTANGHLSYLPLGPVLAIMPWNFPFWQVFRFLAPALMAGNVALLKHASNVPQCASAIQSVMDQAGLPAGVFQNLPLSSSRLGPVIQHPAVVAVTLTGSEAAGQSVAKLAGEGLKKCVLELGGNDPFIVMPSADLQRAVDVGVQARMMNNGQSCICAKRFIIHRDIYSEFQQRFVDAVEQLKVGDPMDDDTDLGPLATKDGAEKLSRQVNESTRAGARILIGGSQLGSSQYFAPTVLTDISPGSPAYAEELFGPVAALFKVSSLEDAIKLANDTPYGLASSVWTNDAAEQSQCAVEIEAGQTFFNAMSASDPQLPFGGIKLSGYGRELGAFGPREFTNIKTIVNRVPQRGCRGAMQLTPNPRVGRL
jgi:succinate-semialdehyde dehydrogenase/glutarate-semialdehyde dehydrogenase